MIGLLNKDYKYKGMTFKAGSLLYLYSNGTVELGTLKEDYEPIKGLIFKANTTISFRSASGKIRFGVLKKDYKTFKSGFNCFITDEFSI